MKLAIVGVGLIGSSFALGARDCGLFDRFVGIDPNEIAREKAMAMGIIDEIAETVPLDCDAILLAGPCSTVADWVIELSSHSAIVFDVGSVKGGIIDKVKEHLGDLPSRYVPCHPIAGRELSGPEAGLKNLFEGNLVIQTPWSNVETKFIKKVASWWEELGATIKVMDSTLHDQMYAVTSHLPHAIVFAYLQGIQSSHLDHAGGGFKDFSRIGASDANIWASIFDLNKETLVPSLDRFISDINQLRDMIISGSSEDLIELIEMARRPRVDYDRRS